MCPKDTCFAEYAVLALRCPPIETLLNWVADTVNTFAHECPIGNGLLTYNEKELDIPKMHFKSAEAICDYYIEHLRHAYDNWHCTGEGDHDSLNEQAGLLLTDCWNVGSFYTFYRIDWYDWMSCGNNARESWWTVDATTGKLLGLKDIVRPEKVDSLSMLMMARLENGKGEYIVQQYPYEPSEYTGVLERANGCALIPEGLVIYFYPYNLGCGADGEYEAVIPYDELKGILYEHIPTHQVSELTARAENDSLYVDGAIYFSQPFVIPLVYKEPTFSYDYSGDEEFRQARLKSPHRVKLRFTEPINSYTVQVTLHPDDTDDDIGMAEWVFSKNGHTIRINNGFYWEWAWSVVDQFHDEPKYEGETYTVAPEPEMIQGRDSIIVDTPFCFKDVDFDGEYELCFRVRGWNRYYFNTYKILSATDAKLMTGHPYNNIVYSNSETCSTEFDYDNQTIHMVEVSGSSVYDHIYGKREVIQDALNPLRHISGQEVNYAGGVGNEDLFEDGKWVIARRIYPLDNQNYELEAEYAAIGEREFALQHLKCYQWDNENVKQLLYKKN